MTYAEYMVRSAAIHFQPPPRQTTHRDALSQFNPKPPDVGRVDLSNSASPSQQAGIQNADVPLLLKHVRVRVPHDLEYVYTLPTR